MKHQDVGYIRVSSEGQNTDRQLQDVELDKKFIDIETGSVKERKQLIACIDYVREGDTLIVDSIDRLARNLRDLQDIVKSFTEKGVSVRFLKENLSFSTNHDPLANLTLHIMGAFAEFERTMIRTRQREGIEIARKAGKYGRPLSYDDKTKKKIIDMKAEGVSIRRIAMTLKLSRGTIYKVLGL